MFRWLLEDASLPVWQRIYLVIAVLVAFNGLRWLAQEFRSKGIKAIPEVLGGAFFAAIVLVPISMLLAYAFVYLIQPAITHIPPPP